MPRFKDIPRCTISHTYREVGRCIYCFRDDVELTEEHIIPESIGGMMKLPRSSCRGCATVTHAFEGRVVSRIYGDARAHLGTRRKRNKKFGDEFVVERTIGGQTESVSVSFDDHPGAVVLLALKKPPGILKRLPLREVDDWGNVDLALWFAPGAVQNMSKIGGRLALNKNLPISDLARFLAKIAHSYAVATLGLGSFKPFLTDAILSSEAKHLSHFVGGRPFGVPAAYPDLDLHELMLSEIAPYRAKDPRLWMVSLRLFAPLSFPIYDVVVGEVTR